MSRIEIGANITRASQLGEIGRMLEEGTIDFVEILLDNFLSCDPVSIRRALRTDNIGFHIMRSRFLERDEGELRELGHRISAFIQEIGPRYVSDHLAVFSSDGQLMPMIGEIDYDAADAVLERCRRWQGILGCELLLENFPSQFEGAAQIDFFQALTGQSMLGLLFDISNAEVAAGNGGPDIAAWSERIRHVRHFHVGGFSAGETSGILIDSHDRPLRPSTKQAVIKALNWSESPIRTLTVEYDHDIDYHGWTRDIREIREGLPK
jgi:uncharacterized protein (UPF0276 family)